MQIGLEINSARRARTASPLLSELKTAHSDLLDATEELAELTRGPVPTKGRLIDTRWKVSRASLSRRLLWGRILLTLSGAGGAREEAEIRHLQEIDIELLRASTAHVGRWTADAVLEDWNGYRRASATMRAKMKVAIDEERTFLYPLLARFDRRGG